MSLDFSDAKVYISNVDSQASANGGIMVQVIGELSNRGQAWRKFAQTFFLAEQPNGYYVLNDICRYLKEDTVDYSAEVEAPAAQAGESAAAPAASAVVEAAAPAAADVEALKEDEPVLEEAKAEVAVAEETKAEPVEEEAAPAKEEDKVEEPVLTNGHATAHEEAKAKEEEAIAAQPEHEPTLEAAPATEEDVTPTESEAAPSIVEITTPEAAEPVAEDKPAPLPEQTPEPVAAPAPAPAAAAPAPAPAAPSPVPTPAPAPTPATPKTWASLAASNKTAWGSRASETKGVSSAAPVVANAAPAQAPASAPAAGPSSGGGKPQLLPGALAVSSPSVFVKGVVETIQDDQLRSTLLARFGPMKECDIIRSVSHSPFGGRLVGERH